MLKFNYIFNFVVWILYIKNVNGFYQTQPKILSEDGELIIESAVNKNITFRLTGTACLLVNDINLLDLVKRNRIPDGASPVEPSSDIVEDVNNLKRLVIGSNGLADRIRRVENGTTGSANLRVNRLQRRVRILTNRVSILERKLRENNCSTMPCRNGGTCIDLFDDYLCQCTNNWEGKSCDVDVDECARFAGTDLGCQNNAACINLPGTYQCQCTSGWFGLHCTRREVDCNSGSPAELCGHGACVPENSMIGYKCICEQGWKTNGVTPSCSVDVDECAESKHNCMSGCINLPGSFMCAPCSNGYTGNGVRCTDIDECENNNGGCSLSPRVECINTQGSYRCGNCPAGWSGDGRTCIRDQTTDCASARVCHPLAHCQLISNMYVCTCPVGMTGSGYGQAGCTPTTLDPCSPNHCLNGGSCVRNNSSYTCVCTAGFEGQNCQLSKQCHINPCQNGGTCVTQVQLPGFKCMCRSGFAGSLCDRNRFLCGTVVRQSSGSIRFPPFGSYASNERCAFLIKTDEEKILNIIFTKFDVQVSEECRKDFLQIHDGRSAASQLIGRFCGPTLPKGGAFNSTHNQVYFWFRSDDSVEREGFSFSWNSSNPICGGKTNITSHGTIQSPGYPGKAPPNRDCVWELLAPPSKVIQLAFFEIELPNRTDCDRDYLEILDDPEVRRELRKFCSTVLPQPLQSLTNAIFINFHTDNQNFDSAFKIHYSLVDGIPQCGGTFAGGSGVFESPIIGDMSSAETICNYLIRGPDNATMELKFEKFHLSFYTDCQAHSVEIFDGKDEDSPLFGRWCSDEAPENLTSTSNYLFVKYKFTAPPLNNYYGFKGTFRIACGGTFTSPMGIITSPLYPQKYLPDRTCIYKIDAPAGNVITIKMEDFALASFYGECYEDSDYLNYYSPELQERYKEGHYCASAPETFVSKYNTLVLEFISNPSAIRAKERGFKASYSFEAIGCGGVYKDTNGTISYTISNFVQVGYKFCEWILFAPIGHQIYLEFELFNLNDAPNNCTSQKFSIYTNETDPGKLVGHYCGTPPMTATYASTIISLQFEFNQIIRAHGFRANYKFIDGSQACGGRYITPTGTIQSPGWPHEYNRGSNCVWIIRAAQNQQIELNVKQFILEGGIDCYYDSLEIRNGDNANSPLIGKYCGETIPKKIPSTSNKLYLHFKTDNSVEEQGFLIEWEAVSTHCGGTLRTHKGSIISPHYPALITEIAQCDWTIVVNAGSKMSINLTTVPDTYDCTLEYLSFYDGPDPTSGQLSPTCDNFKTIKSTSNAVFIRYLTTTGGGSGAFMLDYKIDCKNELRDLFGVIESPNYPDPYPIRLNCQWTIKAQKGNKISIAFSHIDLEMSDDICVYDYLEISHIRNGEVVNRTEICSMDRLPPVITSVGDAIMVSFTTDESRAGTGFRLEYQIEGCGRYFTSKGGRFESPNSPYSVDVHCEWVIEADYGNVVELTVLEFHMETSTDCNENGLLISNDKNGNNTLLQMCHTEETSHVVTSTGRMIYIKFYTDNIRYQKYVKASFRVIPSVCGGNFRATKGEIYSPYYPQAYGQSNCEWLVSTEPHHTLDLQFKFFDLENSVDCVKDYVEIYNGPKKNPYNLLLKHCGPYLPTENLLQTTESKALVVFKSDNSTAKNSGFALTFSKNCGKEFVDENTGFFIKGVNDHNCVWTIRTTNESSHISLHFTNVQCNCEEAPVDQCESIKGVAVLEGVHKHSSFCQHHPPSIVSNGQILTVEGKTGSFEAYFSLYENSCGGILKSLKGKFASPRYPNSYPTNIECVWEIISTDGSFIELTFETMDILNSEHCSEDYLEVRERNSSGKVLGLYCSSDIPTVLTIFEKAWIKFRSDNDFVGRGFIASWNYAHNNYINGTAGKIRSPSTESIRNDPVDFNWQVEVTRGNVISLAFIEYNQGLKIFDGFDESAQEIELQPSPYQMISSTNIIYIQAKNQMLHKFLIEWREIPRSSANETTNDYCPKGIIEVPSQQSKNISSPGYPVNYPDDLDCEWILKPNASGNHVFLRLYEANLEDLSDCSVDYLLISSSEDLVEWKLEKKLCTGEYSLTPIEQFHGRPYLKINFHTDISISKSGFTGLATSVCGGTLTDTDGVINGVQMQNALLYSINTCVWQIRVRPGRKIQLKFVRMNIPNRNSDRRCQNGYVSIRDGYDEHSAYLGGIGRYCSGTEIDLPETLSHRALIKAAFLSSQDLDWMISYNEISEECGYTVQLTNEDNETTISTPNYPNTPKPYTECIWLVMAPIGESLYLSFEGIFDLSPSAFCQKENVEIRDGSTSISRLVGKYCYKRKPYQSTGNGLYLKYTTNTPEPRIGFEAKIKIAKCGGSYDASSYEVKSEKYPALGAYPSNSTCEYRISVWRYYRLNLTLTDIHLPYAQNSSENDHLKLYVTPDTEFDKDLIEITSIYGNNTLKFLEVETNKILIKFFTFKPNSQYRGFRIRFTRIPGRCGRDIIAESGRLTMPVHSDRRYFLFCQWTITVPKGRRVKLEITKVEEDPQAMGTHTIAVYNDPIRTMPITFINKRNARFVQSTDNFMLIKIYRGHDRKLLALDMNFTSEEQSLCPPDFGDSGTFATTAYTGTYYCKSSFKLNSRQTIVFYLTLQHQRARVLQDYEFPLVIKGTPSITLSYGENLDNKIVPISASEGTLEIRQYSPDINITRYNIGYRKFECGGIEILESTLTFTKPNMTSVTGSYDCAWQLRPRYQRKFNLTATYKLNLNCSQEYLEIYAGLEPIESFKKVCGNDSFQFIIHTEGSYLHYHSITDNPSSSFEIHIKPAANCGGTITENYGNLQDIEFSSSDYQNNLECVWDILPKKGMSTEINFYGRFYIQESNDCSKDYLEIRQLVGDEWTPLPRICGRHLPDSINITNTKVQIIFRSDESKTGDGFNIKFRSICGGTFEVTGDKQYLEFPLGIEYHTFSFVCNYTLVTSTSELIQINFLTFDLDTNGRCPSGRMKVFKEDYYEISMEQAGTYCTSNSVKSFKARHQIYLVFEASLYRQIPIYKFEYYLDICGGPITNSTVIQTPKDESGDAYPPSMNCLWNITAPEDQAIVIQFKNFDMHNYFECSYDYVYIYSGKEMKSENQINRLCGNLTGVYPLIKIPGNRALLLAKSDESTAGSGFTAAIKFVKKCDEKINLTETNPSYAFNRFAQQYEHELDCHYQFNAPNGYFVMAEFHNFNISKCENKPECVCDFLEARDGDEATSQILATYCGNTVPTTVLSTSESLLLRFVSDGQGSATGFSATVRIVKSECGSNDIILKWDEGTHIASPNFGVSSYPPNTICKWVIESNNTIELNFEKIDLEEADPVSGTCLDYVDIMLLDQVDNEHDVLCGSQTPHSYYLGIGATIVQILFKTNGEVQRAGFKLTARQTHQCNVTYAALSGRIQKRAETSCAVHIIVPENYTLSFHFRNFYLTSENCTKQFLKFIDERTGQLIKTLCESTFESLNVFTNTNQVKIDVAVDIAAYFDITYVASNEGTGCGGNLDSTMGQISSPFYPENVRNYTQCRWNIHGAKNKRIQFSFLDFDMGSNINCDSDYVQFLEISGAGQERVTRKFCGQDKPGPYVSNSNEVSIVYKKTVNFDGSGWVLRYLSITS